MHAFARFWHFSHIGLALYTGILFYARAHHFSTSFALGLFGFSTVLLGYTGQRLFYSYSKNGIQTPLKRWLVRRRTWLFIFLLIGTGCGTYSLTQCIAFPAEIGAVLLINGIVTVFYVVPLPLLGRSLRSLPGTKIIWILFSWSSLLFASVRLFGIPFDPARFCAICFWIAAIALRFDVESIESDGVQLKSIPQLIGRNATSCLILLFQLIAFYVLPTEHAWLTLFGPLYFLFDLFYFTHEKYLSYAPLLWDALLLILAAALW